MRRPPLLNVKNSSQGHASVFRHARQRPSFSPEDTSAPPWSLFSPGRNDPPCRPKLSSRLTKAMLQADRSYAFDRADGHSGWRRRPLTPKYKHKQMNIKHLYNIPKIYTFASDIPFADRCDKHRKPFVRYFQHRLSSLPAHTPPTAREAKWN